ncbi:TELO2-interacting protein 1 homolog [Aplysia californica]|uniref:TELO2-interacting protein 1 homolog n=1 Tax=Aplysia californica TaxID=6500 RepID=A0ABM0K773_APLCA|nr:TELO2-interacting protein 1 homolog [Aplysia californica]
MAGPSSEQTGSESKPKNAVMEADDHLTAERSAGLALMKPLCIGLMQERTTGSVQAILNALPRLDDDVAREIQVYILFPVKTALSMKDLSDNMFLALCQVIEALYRKTKMAEAHEVYDIIGLILLRVAPPKLSSQIPKMSEDSKKAMCDAVNSVLSAMPKKAFEKFYILKNVPAIGQLISVLLQIAEFERSKASQFAALSCMKTLYFYESVQYGPTNEIDDFTCLKSLTFCLPAVTMAAARIITGDSKQGHKVFVEAAHLWTIAVYRAIDNRVYQNAVDKSASLQKQKKEKKGDPLDSLTVVADTAWVETTAEKLKVLLEKICTARSHSHHKARMALVSLGSCVLIHCNSSLSGLVPLAVDLLVGYLADPRPEVSQRASEVLRTFAADANQSGHKRFLVETLQENLYNLCTSLPRQMRMADEEEKPAIIRLLRGYLTLLGTDVRTVLLSQAHLKRVCLALVNSLELDTSDIQILEERNTLLHQDQDVFVEKSSSPVKVWKRRKYFKHVIDPEVISELLRVCQLLGKFGDLAILVDFFLELYHESSTYQPAAILIINEMIVGVTEAAAAENVIDSSDELIPNLPALNDLITLLLDEYLSTENLALVSRYDDTKSAASSPSSSLSSSSSSQWMSSSLSLLPSSSSSTSSSSLLMIESPESFESKKRLSQRNRAIMLACLFMEGVGNFAMALGSMFESHMVRALYPLVENLGHENVHLSSTAYFALTHICTACGYNSLDLLMQENADYLVSSVSLRLRHITVNRRCPQTLSVMMRYCSSSLLPIVEHSILQLLDTLDDHYAEELLLFLPALLELATAIGRWFPSPTEVKEEAQVPEALTAELDPQSIVAFVEEYVRTKKTADMEEDGNEMSDGDGTTEERKMEDIEADMQKLMEEQRKEEERQEAAAEAEEEQEREKEKTEECPRHLQVVIDILQRVKHFLTSPDGRLRIKSLDILCQCVTDLKGNSKELLPQIHQLWASFYPLFRSEEKFVVIKALTVLHLISDLGGDFVRQKTMKNVIPGLSSFMDKQGKISSGSKSAYQITGNYKLQLAALHSLGPIAKNLCLDSGDLESVAKMCLPYLCDKQPRPLQQASIESFSFFIGLDPDAMWFLLSQVHFPPMPEPPGPEFEPIKVPHTSDQKNSFKTNVQHLFDTFFS